MERETRPPVGSTLSKSKKKNSILTQILFFLSVVTVLQLIVIIALIFNMNDKIDTTVRDALYEYFDEIYTEQSEQLYSAEEQFENFEHTGNTQEVFAVIDEADDIGLLDTDNYKWFYEDEVDYTDAVHDEFDEYQEIDNIEYIEDTVINVSQQYNDSPYFESDMPPLFNRANPISDDYNLDLMNVGGGHQMHAKAAQPLLDMIQSAKNDGISIWIVSAYRTNARQTANFNNSVNNHISQGMGRVDAEEATARWIAIPGTSEHEAGLAVDFNLIEERFDQTREYRWLIENSADFGFILRYQKETEHITGIAYEPWHYRYVGINHAKRIVEEDIALEEYLEKYMDN